MLVEVFDALMAHLAEMTGPGKTFALPPTGVLWTPIAPVPGVREALDRALKMEKAHIGVVMPTGDRRIDAARSPYPATSTQAGAIRELSFYTTLFARSGRAWALDGVFLELPGWLEFVFREFGHPSVHDTVRMESVRFYGAGPDYLILEANCSLKYLSPINPPEPIPLRGFILSNQYGEWFRVYLD
ncbi:hypothetical protein MN1_840 [Thermus phage MN1]|nr:hypothetical protein MN1_840 [Thermus phage MN1]